METSVLASGAIVLASVSILLRWSHSWRWQRELLERRVEQRSRQLRLGQAITHRILDSIPDGVVLTDEADRVIFSNLAARRILHVGDDHPAVAWARATDTLRTRPPDLDHPTGRRFATFTTSRDERVVLEIVTSAISDAEPGSIHVLRDVTEATTALEIKNQFVAGVSHEIRTPLTAIVSSLHLIDAGAIGPTNDRIRRLVEVASRSADRLMRLVNDVLDHQRLESGVADMHAEVVTVDSFVEEATATMQEVARHKDIVIAVTGIDRSVTAFVDPDRMAQVVINLLSNAVKFSAPGARVELVIETRPADVVRISVVDECPTIPVGKRESIFELFTQVDATDTRPSEGSGLGLWICRRILDRHEGRIWVEPNPIVGNRFIVEFPRRLERLGQADRVELELSEAS